MWYYYLITLASKTYFIHISNTLADILPIVYF